MSTCDFTSWKFLPHHLFPVDILFHVLRTWFQKIGVVKCVFWGGVENFFMGEKSYLALLARLKRGAHKQEGEYGKRENSTSTGSIHVGKKHLSDFWECFWGVRTIHG